MAPRSVVTDEMFGNRSLGGEVEKTTQALAKMVLEVRHES